MTLIKKRGEVESSLQICVKSDIVQFVNLGFAAAVKT